MATTPIFLHLAGGADAHDQCLLAHAGAEGMEVYCSWLRMDRDLAEVLPPHILTDFDCDYPGGWRLIVADAQRAQLTALLPGMDLHSAEAVIAEQARLHDLPVPPLAEPRLMVRAWRLASGLSVCPPIVFLDIDDVLVATPAALALEENQRRLALIKADPRLPRTIANLPTVPDPAAVERLVGLLEVTQARIVLISNWRRGVPTAELERWLEDAGLTPWLHEDWRAPWKLSSWKIHDLGFWTDDHPDFERGVVPDNDDWLTGTTLYRPSVSMVEVDGGEGLQDRHAYQALQALGVSRATAYLLTCPPAKKPGEGETLALFGKLINRRRG